MKKILVSWSGGKDGALALHELKKSRDYEISALLTTVTEDHDRVSMHGVRRVLLESQAESIGLPVEKVYIPKGSSNEEYEARMKKMLAVHRGRGVSSVSFGDIFLEDIRKHRENNLAKINMKAVFPIWKRNTAELAREFISLGFKAVITCVDLNALAGDFAGREFDEKFLSLLPSGADPCGENGEFHSFVYDGPVFRSPVPHKKGEAVVRDGRFCYCDILPL